MRLAMSLHVILQDWYNASSPSCDRSFMPIPPLLSPSLSAADYLHRLRSSCALAIRLLAHKAGVWFDVVSRHLHPEWGYAKVFKETCR